MVLAKNRNAAESLLKGGMVYVKSEEKDFITDNDSGNDYHAICGDDFHGVG